MRRWRRRRRRRWCFNSALILIPPLFTSSPLGGHSLGLCLCSVASAERGWRTDTHIDLHLHLPVCLSTCLSVCLPVCLSVYLSVCLPVCLSVCLSVYLEALQGELLVRTDTRAWRKWSKWIICCFSARLCCAWFRLFPLTKCVMRAWFCCVSEWRSSSPEASPGSWTCANYTESLKSSLNSVIIILLFGC